jgi:hypothetical protein
MFFAIGMLVLFFVSLVILSRWIGERRYDRALKKTDYGVVCNFMCDITNKLIGLSPSRIVTKCAGYYLHTEFEKQTEESMKNA